MLEAKDKLTEFILRLYDIGHKYKENILSINKCSGYPAGYADGYLYGLASIIIFIEIEAKFRDKEFTSRSSEDDHA